MGTARGDLPLSARRALRFVLAAVAVYALLDLLNGVEFSGDDSVLIASDAFTLVWQALLVHLVRQRRLWAWGLGAAWSALSAVAGVAMVVDPRGLGGYDQDVPQPFVVVQALLLVAAAGLWFAPDVRPTRVRRAQW